MVTSIIMVGCNTKQAYNTNALTSELQASQQVRIFFDQYPEYVESPKKEAQLFTEFQHLTKVPGYNKLSMYQLLIISHDRLQR
ncbi:hypothetical protein J4198_005417 [Salmonella enterica]|nr:hypothetical protein [Salmonella enterica]EHG6848599.1 hypothetical protein [Salmonella enterica]